MPSEMGAGRPVFGISSKTIFGVIALLIVVGGILMVRTGWMGFLGNLFPAALPLTPIPAPPSEIVTIVPTLETDVSALEVPLLVTETPTPVFMPIDAATPHPGDTVIPLPYSHGFEVTRMPPGSDQSYLVHIVAVGETLDTIANHYNTTVQAIITVNYKFKPPVLLQYPLVIPVGTKDATGLPAFKVYVVGAYESISAESLADVLSVDANALELYNLCTANCQFHKGDVLLIPYIQ